MKFVLSPPEGSLTTLVHWECVLNEANLCLGLGYDLSGTSGMTFGKGVWVLRAKMGRDFCHFALSPSLNCFWEVYYSVSPNICILSLLKTFISCVIKHVTLQPSSRDEIFFTRFANPHPESGFSPVWLSIWFFRVQRDENYQSQTFRVLEQSGLLASVYKQMVF